MRNLLQHRVVAACRGALGRSLAIVALLPLLSCATQKPGQPHPEAPSFDGYMSQATAAMSRGDYEDAVGRLKEAIAVRPNSARAHNFLGMAYEQRQEYELARESFEKAVAIDPSFASAYNNIGGVLSLTGHYEQAVQQFEKALALAPEMVAAHYNMGSALLALGRDAQAMPYLIRAITLDPNFLSSGATMVAMTEAADLGGPGTAFLYAKLFASTGNVEKTVEYLSKARNGGFANWQRIYEDQEFEKVRSDPRVAAFLIR